MLSDTLINKIEYPSFFILLNTMYVRINKEQGWTSWLRSYLGYLGYLGYQPKEILEVYRKGSCEDDVSEEGVLSEILEIDASPDKIEKIKNSMVDIKLGLTFGGTNTNNLSKGVIEMLKLRGAHIALADMYTTDSGFQYRCHMSSVEKNHMIREFELEQKELSILVQNGFYQCDESIFDELSQNNVFSSDDDS